MKGLKSQWVGRVDRGPIFRFNLNLNFFGKIIRLKHLKMLKIICNKIIVSNFWWGMNLISYDRGQNGKVNFKALCRSHFATVI